MQENTQEKQQWKKRVDTFRYIFECLSNNYSKEEIIKKTKNQDEYFLKTIEYFSTNFTNIVEKIKQNINSSSWSWERTKLVDKAIIITAICESFANSLEKKVSIDQAIVNAKNYSEKNSYKFINAILDKIL
ncbi:MAG: hypothetical protein LBF02_00300 [Mycoplasmataceae bacterium]|nr:hypothetical protein [Mycoplasmataceae bacterium]